MRAILTTILTMIAFTASSQADPNFHIYLCLGQSNMQGSAPIEEQDREGVERFVAMAPANFAEAERVQGEWYRATPPLSQPYSQLSPADYFGREMVQLMPDSVKVGVIVVAIGGSDIRLFDKDLYLDYMDTYPEQWFKDQIGVYGDDPYGRLVHLAKLAQRDGVIKGVLLHQGETNKGDKEWPRYVDRVYNNLLNDLNLKAKDLPLLAGEVVNASEGGQCASMNEIIATLPKRVKTAYVVSSEGCTALPDSIHFDSKGVRELGRRYAEKMVDVKEYNK